MRAPLPAPTGESPSHGDAIWITLVTSAGCHFCHDAEELLAGLARRFSLHIERIDLASPEGAELARHLRVPFPPALLIDGEYFGHGRISDRTLTRALDAKMESR